MCSVNVHVVGVKAMSCEIDVVVCMNVRKLV